MTFGPIDTYFSYLPEQYSLPSNYENARRFIEDRERLTASILNIKSIGNFQEYVLQNGDQWFTSVVDGQFIPNYGFRLTLDLVEFNGGVIPPGVTNFTLTPTTIPPNIPGVTKPLPSYGSGTIAGPTYVFTGTDFNVRFNNTNPASQVITLTNNTGTNLTQCYWVFNFLQQ